MTVLGKVPVPKHINLPSQRLENHGLDPNVEIVPRGTLSWGSKSSSSSNAWGFSTLSPHTDGGGSSPSHLSARLSSGGNGIRSSTTSLDSLHLQSAETKPGSSQLSRFAEAVLEYSGAWGGFGTVEKLIVLEAQKFRTSGIDPKFEGKLDQMFMRIVATGDKAWAPSSGTLRSDFFEDVNNEIPKENEEENVRNDVHILNDVHISNDVQIDGNGQKRKKTLRYEVHILKLEERNPQSKFETWIREILDSRESRCMINFRMSKMVFTSLLRVLEIRYNLQTSRNISSSEMLGIFLYILGTGAKVSQCRERFQRSGSTISQYFAIDCIGAIDGTHITVILPPNEQIPYIGRKGIPTQNVMVVCDLNMCFTFVMAGLEGPAHDTRIFLDAIRDPKYKFSHPPNGNYYLVDSGYPQMKGYFGPYRGQRYHLPDFRRGRSISGKEEIFNHSHSSLRSVIERTFGVLKKKWAILRDMPSYSFEKQTMIVVATMTMHNFIRKHVRRNDADFMEYEDINWAYENIIDSENAHGRESDDDDDNDDDGDDGSESNNSSGFEMELT
ncbi:hypothetical protein J1N35_044843 [Gossypium stocksii]|uniref:DDE Tnp4 domain-containing protein n=1 Tax=Gossypium stocksii TaxID=47602 RepID=A0A9D3UA55_9ROSI|nr:hypothetical protein J1N35_044843 [Gossypium stocksii]